MAEAGLAPVFSVGLVVLGSVLGATFALGGSIAVEVWRARRDDRRKVLLIKGLLRQEIPEIMKSARAIRSSLEEHRFFPKAGVQLINRSLQSFDRNREWVTLVKNSEIRQEMFQYYASVGVFCYALEEAASEGPMAAEVIEPFVEISRRIIEKGESLLKRLDEL